ncbi:MAG: NADH-quinone oxidoreductase subunit A [Actinobacteria bacterium]|nr:NADH-quinone oxidoreductase subunit A [Actinomycetota bacterium]
MLSAFAAVVTAAAVVAATVAGIAVLRRQPDPSSAHWSTTLPVLGGSEPQVHAWNRFHARYYPMTLVLVAFEMEMMFMYPWAVVFAELGVKALVEMGVFLALLSLGVLYAWREGALRWQ